VQHWERRFGLGTEVSVHDIVVKANETKLDGVRYPKFRALLVDNAGRDRGDEIEPRLRIASWPPWLNSTAIQSSTPGPISSTNSPDMIRTSKSLN